MNDHIRARLNYLRGEIRAERVSYGDIVELQALTAHIDPGDVELLEWAGVPEFPSGSETDSRGIVEVTDLKLYRLKREADIMTCGTCGRSWDDGIATAWTPTPGGRCPFEDEHADEDDAPPVSPNPQPNPCPFQDVSTWEPGDRLRSFRGELATLLQVTRQRGPGHSAKVWIQWEPNADGSGNYRGEYYADVFTNLYDEGRV